MKEVPMTTTSSHTGQAGGNRPDHIISGLVEDRNKIAPTIREQVNRAISTLTVRLPKLPEHGAEDDGAEQEGTTKRLRNLMGILDRHFDLTADEDE
jgi:hypothetical protein